MAGCSGTTSTSACGTRACSCFVAAVGSLSVSYVRARAEVERIKLYDGLFTRAVRVIVLAAGLVVGEVVIVLWVLAVMTVLTTLQRLSSPTGVCAKTAKEPAPRDPGR